MLFETGRIVVTTGAQFFSPMAELEKALKRHQMADWGDVDDEQKLKNAHGVLGGDEIRSSYLIDGERVCIITMPSREHTTICISEDL